MHNSRGNGKAAREKCQFLTTGHCDVTGGGINWLRPTQSSPTQVSFLQEAGNTVLNALFFGDIRI